MVTQWPKALDTGIWWQRSWVCILSEDLRYSPPPLSQAAAWHCGGIPGLTGKRGDAHSGNACIGPLVWSGVEKVVNGCYRKENEAQCHSPHHMTNESLMNGSFFVPQQYYSLLNTSTLAESMAEPPFFLRGRITKIPWCNFYSSFKTVSLFSEILQRRWLGHALTPHGKSKGTSV